MHYLPGRMRFTDLEPNAYWGTDVIDVELGAAVRRALQVGKETAEDAHKATRAMDERKLAMMKGRAQC